MPDYFLRLADDNRTWALYALVLCLLTALCFGNLRHHMLDTHDLETFIDHQQIDDDWTFFFSSHKGQDTGRPLAELVKYGAHLVWGTNPAAFHLLVVLGEYGIREIWGLIAGMGRVLFWLTSRLFTTAHWVPLPVYERLTWELYLGAILVAGLLALVWKRVETGRVWSAWLLLWLAPFLLLTEKTVFELPAGLSAWPGRSFPNGTNTLRPWPRP